MSLDIEHAEGFLTSVAKDAHRIDQSAGFRHSPGRFLLGEHRDRYAQAL